MYTKVWVLHSGLDVDGEINIAEPRYLCDKHFSLNYISNQSRRKMLVHTAIPEKWNGDTEQDISEASSFNVVGYPVERKRRLTSYVRRELFDQKPFDSDENMIKLKRKLHDSMTSYESNDGSFDLQSEKKYCPLSNETTENPNNLLYEEVTIQPKQRRTYQCIVVKPKKSKSPKTTLNYIKPSTSAAKEEDTFFLTEEGNITSSNLEPEAKQEETTANTSHSRKSTLSESTLENYSEFIYNGMIYVQMPKQVFEQEKEKWKMEALKYKNILLKMKHQIESVSIDD